MEKYEVTGMSCAACVARVEKAVGKVEGVTSCSVSLLTNSMAVEGSAGEQAIIEAVEKAGYGAAKSGSKKSGSADKSSASSDEDQLADKETPVLLKRLFMSLGFLIVLMYVSMGHMMWNFPLPSFFDGNHVAVGLVQLILSSIILIINKKFFINGTKGLIHRSPNMDTLVALGSGVSYLWSLFCLFAMTRAVCDGNSERVTELMGSFYFESAAMILTLITVGKTLEAKSKGRTTDALRSLMKLSPKSAVILRDGKEVSVDIEDVLIGDTFIVRPGDNIPVDGIVLEGSSAVNESALTGESIPVDKKEGSHVSSGTLNTNGFLKCRAVKVGSDTTLSQIIQMVSDAASTKAPIAKIADKVSGVFVPAVISLAVITLAVWLLCGADVGYALARGISVLVISCPCALGLATPVAIMVGNGKGAKNGILFKTAESLEMTGKVDVVVMDKTGTITKGEPTVTDIIVLDAKDESELLQAAVNLESKSGHPLGKAVLKTVNAKGFVPESVNDFEAVGGKGVRASVVQVSADGKESSYDIAGGNLSFVNEFIGNAEASKVSGLEDSVKKLSVQGKTPLIFAERKDASCRMLGIIAVADVIKNDSGEAVKEFQKMGKQVVMLTGDNQVTADEIGRQVGVDKVVAGVLPEGKLQVIKDLQKEGKKVAMVGDGINDAPALTQADVGIAIGAGTDVAIDAADVVLVKSSLVDAVNAVLLSKKTLLNIKENLFWAFIYNVIGIPLAAGCYIHAFGWTLNPMFGAAAMSLSSFCVVTNALRLNFARLHASEPMHENNKEESNIQGGHKMTKTLKVEGMMCQHCEKHVREALEKIDGVTSVVASHEKKTAVVELSKDVPEDSFKAAVVDAGYEYKGME
ncbi:MAG: heavy metal translocating P-type ATPase [Treponema sp.]|nr:heavy metal translocating P-type ATPase [Treponema sp.]